MDKKTASLIKYSLFFNIFFIFLFASCRLEIPIREMSLAKANLTRAVEVRSEKYAPEEYENAKNELLKTHDHMKAEEIKEAKTAAENSIKFSDAAIARSLPLLAEDNLDEADKYFNEAVKAYAEEYAPDEYTLAEDKILESDDLFRIDRYWDSYLKSNEAISHAISARDKALSNAEVLRKKIQDIKDGKDELIELDDTGIAADELRSIDESVSKASSMLDESNLKDAIPLITEAEKILENASMKVWSTIADGKIKLAENALKDAEASPKKDTFKAEIEEARGLIDESREYYEDRSFPDSISKSEQAIEVLNSIAVAAESLQEEKKIDEEKRIIESGESEIREYVVKYNPEARDCLWRIAHNVYKDAKLWPLIYVANRDQIKDPDLIFPGQKFKIPEIPGTAEIKESDKKEDNTSTSGETEIDKNEVIEPRSSAEDETIEEITDTEDEAEYDDEYMEDEEEDDEYDAEEY